MKRRKSMSDKRIRHQIFFIIVFFATLFSVSSSAYIWDVDSPFPWDDMSRETIYFKGESGNYYGHCDTLQYCAFADGDFCWLASLSYDILERDALERPAFYGGLEYFFAYSYYRGPFGSFDIKETAKFEDKEYQLIGAKCAFSNVEGFCEQYPVFNVTFPDNLKYFYCVFDENDCIEKITLPRDLEVMEHCVNGCKNIKELKLPASLQILKSSVKFLDIEEVILPPNLKNVGRQSFNNLPKLKSIDFGDSLEEIGRECFNDMPLIENISLPVSIRKIESTCFDGLTALKTVEFNSIQPIEMGENFNICPVVQKIVLKCPEAFNISDKCFKDVDFDNCLLVVPYGSKNAYQSAAGWCRFKNIIEDLSGVDCLIDNDFDQTVIFSNNILSNSTIKPVMIYTVDGKLLKMLPVSEEFEIKTPGVYVYSNGISSGKIIVK